MQLLLQFRRRKTDLHRPNVVRTTRQGKKRDENTTRKRNRSIVKGWDPFKQMGPGLLCVRQLLWDETAEMPAAT